MALYMPDAVNVNDLPVGYPAYLGYVDGAFPTGKVLPAMFPEAQIVLLTVYGTAFAHGVRVAPGSDVEPGDLTAEHGAVWAKGALADNPAARPVIYASVEGELGYGMPEVMLELASLGISRSRVRLLSADWTGNPHVCGPGTCKKTSVPMDGTQWTNDYKTPAGAIIDMSLLDYDFFSSTPLPVSTETEKIVQELGIVRQGDTGPAVRTVQGLCNARGTVNLTVTIDGEFGIVTDSAVKGLQHAAGITADGIVGPLTWPVLLGIA